MFKRLAIKILLTVFLVLFFSCHYSPAETDFITIADSRNGLKLPDGLDFDDEGNLFVANEKAHNVLRITPKGEISIFADQTDGLIEPEDLVFHKESSTLFVSDDTAATIFRFSGPHKGVVFLNSADGLIQPEGMVFDANDNLFFADEERHCVFKVNLKDKKLIIFADFTSGIVCPEDIEFDPKGNLYVVDDENASVFIFNREGKRIGWIDRSYGLIAPEAIHCDTNGTVFFTDSGLNQIFKLSPTFSPVRVYPDRNDISPKSIIFDKNNVMYITDADESTGRSNILKIIQK